MKFEFLGRLPGQTLAERHKRREARENFIYSVRFRSGPLGIVFDNKLADTTVVEQIVKGQQAHQSDIKVRWLESNCHLPVSLIVVYTGGRSTNCSRTV
jgi:hypothetical protein